MVDAEKNSLSSSIKIKVKPAYLEEHSEPELAKYVFAYTVNICNEGLEPVQLLSRHWIITDGNNAVREVTGEGVVGEQPHIAPGKCYQYSSGAVLSTKIGTMEGSYQMISSSGEIFDAAIEPFGLVHPRSLQ